MARGNHSERGLVDAHVHLDSEEGIATLLSSGISAVRNAGMTISLRPGGVRQLGGPGCIVVSSIRALYKPGGYGSRFGMPIATKGDAKAEIHKLKKAGADIIKVMASGLVSFRRPGTVTAGGFDRDELQFIVESAAAQGLPVMAHANTEQAIIAAATAGVLSIEHGFFMTEEALEMMARKGVFWTPTIGAIVRSAEAAGVGTGRGSFVARLVEQHLRMLKQAYIMGVPLAIGTDCVLPDPGYRRAYDAELSFFEQAGISRTGVTRIAVESGARLLGLE